jgi:hypothetical protein
MARRVPARGGDMRARITWLPVAEIALLIISLAVRLWGLDRNGFGIAYYSAAVRSMTQSWHNFVYNAFDPAGFLSVDKPPVALWIQAASAKVFGFRPASVLLLQVLEGVGSVWLPYRLVRWTQRCRAVRPPQPSGGGYGRPFRGRAVAVAGGGQLWGRRARSRDVDQSRPGGAVAPCRS